MTQNYPLSIKVKHHKFFVLACSFSAYVLYIRVYLQGSAFIK